MKTKILGLYAVLKGILSNLAFWFLCQISHLITTSIHLVYVFQLPKKARRISVAYDQTLNSALNGSEDETISSRANRGRLLGKKNWCFLCKLLDILDKDHCQKAAGI